MRKMNNAMACIAIGVAASAFSAPSLAGTAEEIAALNEEIILLQARLKKLEVEEKIAKQQAEIATSERAANLARGQEVKKDPPVPVVRSTEGYNGKTTAVLAYSGGETVSVKEGNTIPGGWVVASIKVNEVILKKDGRSTALKFAHAPTAQPGLPGTP